MNEDFDGRDELVRKHHKDGLNSARITPDDHVKRYTDPWLPAYYSQFDDSQPGKAVMYDNCVEGIIGLKTWAIPVTGVKRITSTGLQSYEQFNLGYLQITESPNGDGTSELLICINGPHASALT